MTEPGQPSITTDQQQERSDQLPSTRPQEHLRYWLTVSVVLLAFVLITASIIVSMQDNTHPTTAHARVIVQEATIIGPLIQHNVPTATVRLTNTGSSPALKAKSRLVMTVWPSKTFPDWEMPLKLTTDVEPIGDITPESSIPKTVSLIAPLTDVQGMHLERKDWFIVILGVIAYTDGTGTLQETNLCLIWRNPADEKMSPCEKWNDR